MSEKLTAPDFDSHSYERPNQKWICGHAAEGQACRLGPTRRGRCQATFECAPVLETKPGETKGRWRCTRPGESCETGPLPDGTCCRPIPKCSPVPTLRTRRGRFTLAVVIATVAFLLIVMGTAPLRTRFINPGKLSSAHSGDSFAELNPATNRSDQTCGACHRAGAAGPGGLADIAFRATPGPFALGKLIGARPAEMNAIDESCQKCHAQHLFHQANVVRDVSCSFCHAEHRGAGPMAAPMDAHCAFCHGNSTTMTAATAKAATLPADAFRVRNARTRLPALGGPVEPLRDARFADSYRPPSGFTRVIHRFAEDHPEFRVHTDKLSDPNVLKFGHALHLTGETIPTLPGGRKLDCVFCHQPDAAGIYYRRINFENHCRVCHSLQFDPETPGLALPHGNPEFVSAFLHSLPRQYAEFAARSGVTGAEEQKQFVQKKLQGLQKQIGSGEDFERRIFFSTDAIGPRAQVGSVSGATRALYPGCAYCHEVKTTPQGGPEITKPVMFERWFLHGEFNHAKHPGVACAECHRAGRSKSTADILLPFKSTCAACHSPRGGVADSCATCHVYHTERR